MNMIGRRMVPFIFFILAIRQTSGIIYRLNDREFEQLPAITYIDEYEECMYDAEPLYCTTELELVSDEPSDLLDLIRDYSERKLTHYNYSSLYRGICVTRSCAISREETLMDRHKALEGCLNKTMWKKYKLKTRLTTPPMCYPTDNNNLSIDKWDILVALLCILIITLNLVASIYDLRCPKKLKSKGVDLLLAFSIPRNWSRLSQCDNKTKPDLETLKCIDGLRATMMLFLIMGHTIFPIVTSISNIRYLEETYNYTRYHFLLNIMYVVEYFFVISGCLLSYNLERSAEKKKLKWTTILSNIFKRWLRLTPSFAIVFAITVTWLRFMGSGPLWQLYKALRLYKALSGTAPVGGLVPTSWLDPTMQGDMVPNEFGAVAYGLLGYGLWTEISTAANISKEVTDCRRFWLWTLTYMTNYKDGSHCMPHAWYLAADMQLYCLSLITLVLVTNIYWRKVVLSMALLIGIITPAIPTYMYNLDTLLNLSPQSLRNYAIDEPSFDFLYKRSHTNIANYVIGLIAGIYLYRLQKNKFDVAKFKKYVVLYWASIPLAIGIIMINQLFYDDGPQVSIYLRVLYQMFARPILAVLFAVLVIGMVFKLEDVCRGIFEWNGWVWIARVSYSTYISHVTIYRFIVGNSTALIKLNLLSIVPIIGLIVIALMFATVFWLILEAPMMQVVKICFESPTGIYDKPSFDIKTK